MKPRRWKSVALGLIVSAWLVPVRADAASIQGNYCVAWVAEEGASAAELPPTKCFETFSRAISHATGGSISLPAAASTLTQAHLDAASPTALSTVIGIEYQYSLYGTPQLVYSTNNTRGCLDGARFTDASVDGSWRSSISSARAYQGCRAKHWEAFNFVGTSITCTCSQMGVMDNRTQSIEWIK